jgi:thiosulfate dehydrogenase (quinone) large subunit
MSLSPSQGLALIRAAFGLYFVVSAFRKTTTGWVDGGQGVADFLGRNLENAEPMYAGFLNAVVIPNAPLFGQLVLLGEWVAGISLLLGLFTRLGGLVGAWLVLNYMLAKGLLNDAGSNDRLFFVACLALGFAAAGLVWGVDGALRPTLEANPISRWLAGIPSRRIGAVDLGRDRVERPSDERRRAA